MKIEFNNKNLLAWIFFFFEIAFLRFCICNFSNIYDWFFLAKPNPPIILVLGVAINGGVLFLLLAVLFALLLSGEIDFSFTIYDSSKNKPENQDNKQ